MLDNYVLEQPQLYCTVFTCIPVNKTQIKRTCYALK